MGMNAAKAPVQGEIIDSVEEQAEWFARTVKHRLATRDKGTVTVEAVINDHGGVKFVTTDRGILDVPQ